MSKKKVLIIPSWYPSTPNDMGGSFFREQAILLSKNFEVTILCFNYCYEYKKISLLQKFLNKFKIININNNKKFKATRLELAKIDDIISTDIITCYNNSHDNYTEWLLSDNFSKDISNLYFTKKNYIPDIIHAQSTVFAGFCAQKLASHFNIPYMITEHYGPFLIHKYTSKIRQDIQYVIENANLMVVVSHHQKRSILMQEFKCYPEIVGNLLDETNFFASDILQKNDTFNILTVGNNSFIKDAETFVKSIKILLKKYENISVNIIGSVKNTDDKNNCDYYKYAQKEGIEKYFNILGVKNRDEILQYYQNTNVFVSTSIAESFGIAVCEAILCEKIVVMVDNGACQDFIIHNENAFVCEIQDSKKIAYYLFQIINKEVFLDTKKNRQNIIEKYGKDTFLEKMTLIYNKTIKV